MRRITTPMLMVGLLWAVGCAGVLDRGGEPHRPDAIDAPVFYTASDGDLAVHGPAVIGTRGEGLNVATSVHQLFVALGIRNEVVCAVAPGPPSEFLSQVKISFPEGLTPAQHARVRQVLGLMRHRL